MKQEEGGRGADEDDGQVALLIGLVVAASALLLEAECFPSLFNRQTFFSSIGVQ